MLISDYIEYHTRLRPESLLLQQGDQQLSFRQGLQRCYQIANGLADLGIAREDRVAILGQNSIDHILLTVAASLIGAVCVPLNYRLSAAELAAITKDAQTRLLIVNDDSLIDVLETMRPELEADLPVFTNQASGQQPSWENFVASQSSQSRSVSAAPDDCILQLYTSGTTGVPKGVLISHSNIIGLAQGSWLMYSAPATTGTTDLVVAPLFHVGGMGSAFVPILAGGAVLLHQQFDPVAIADAIENNSVNTLFMVPAMIQAMLTTVGNIKQRDFSSLKQVLYGASPISATLLQEAMAVFQCDFYQAYGMTETTGGVVFLTAEDHQRALAGDTDLLSSCGRVNFGGQVKIVDADGKTLPQGETGEIAIHSPMNTQGYWHRPEETAKALRDGWMHTGDAGFIDDQGYIYIRDRIKDMVVTGGENVYPVEVEKVLAAHPAIVEAAVIGIPDDKYGESLMAVCVLKKENSLTIDELVQFCRDKIAGYKIPRQMTVVDALPRNPSGKILKTTLRAPYWAEVSRQV